MTVTLENSLEITVPAHKEKERIDKWRDIANIWISSFFGVKIDQKLYKAFSF